MDIADLIMAEATVEFGEHADRIAEQIANPIWKLAGGYGDWRSRVPCLLQNNGDRLSVESRLALFYAAQEAANSIDAD